MMFFGVFFFCRDVCRDEGNGLRLSFFSYGFRFVLLQSPLMLASLFLGISFVCSPVSPAFLRFLVTGLSPFFFFLSASSPLRYSSSPCFWAPLPLSFPSFFLVSPPGFFMSPLLVPSVLPLFFLSCSPPLLVLFPRLSNQPLFFRCSSVYIEPGGLVTGGMLRVDHH